MATADTKRDPTSWVRHAWVRMRAWAWRLLPPLITDEPAAPDLPRFLQRSVRGMWIGGPGEEPPPVLPGVAVGDPLVRLLHDAYVSATTEPWIEEEEPVRRAVIDLADDTRITFVFGSAHPLDQALVRVRRPVIGAREWQLRSPHLMSARVLLTQRRITRGSPSSNLVERRAL